MIRLPNAVMNGVVQLTGKIEMHAVRQMSAMRQIHRQIRITRLENRQINRHVGLRAGMRLHVGVFGPEQFTDSLSRQIFDDIDEFTPAVVAATGISFSIFVGQHRAGRLQNGGTGIVLRSDQLQPFLLPGLFPDNRFPNSRVGLFQTVFIIGCRHQPELHHC